MCLFWLFQHAIRFFQEDLDEGGICLDQGARPCLLIRNLEFVQFGRIAGGGFKKARAAVKIAYHDVVKGVKNRMAVG